jgi:phosphoribosylanthranilate isomerase
METIVPRIKFCGITNSADADAAVEAGAWALGMILWRGSRRRCRIQDAAEIASVHRRRVELVGVFVNPGLDQVVDAAEQIGLTILQLHGEEGPSFCAEAARRTGCRVIKAARVRSRAEIQALAAFHTDFHLLDTYVAGIPGGTGETFTWELAAAHRGNVPLILSGGLDAGNVGEAIAAVRPYAVDVASGTESAPGRKDHAALRAFAAAVVATAPEAEREPEPRPGPEPDPEPELGPGPGPEPDPDPDPDPEHQSTPA